MSHSLQEESHRVVLFGGPCLLQTSFAIPLSPFQQAAVGLIYGHDAEGTSRARLIWLLWNGDDDSPARHRLSQLLFATARRTGRGDLFLLDRDRVLPNLAGIGSDLQVFQRLIGETRVREAAAVMSSGFLSHLSKPTTADFDDWRKARALSLRSKLREAAAAAWSHSEGSADWAKARDAAEVLLELDPDSEAYLKCVVRARRLCGAAAEAEAAYHAWAEREEGRITSNILAEDIESHAGSPGLGADLCWTRHTLPDPPLIGRQTEMRQLLSMIRQASPNSVSPIFVTGEAGIGKTRLLGELCQLAAADGLTVLRARCSPLEQQVPLNTFADAFQGTVVTAAIGRLDQPWRSVILDLLRDSGPVPTEAPMGDPGSISRRLLESIRRLLKAISHERTILWIDDFHWIDYTTAAALEFSVRRWDGGTLVLLLSARAEAYQEPDPASRLVESCHASMRVLELDPLAPNDTHALATLVLGRSLSPSQRSRFLALTDGVPLFVVEAAHELSEGRLGLSDGGLGAGISIPMQRIVGERLALLRPLDREILDLIVVAEHLSLAMIEEIVRESRNTVFDSLQRLINLRLVADEDPQLRCNHELMRHGVYRRMAHVKRRGLHGVVAEVLARSSSEQDVGQIALHFHRAEIRDQAFRFASAAALRAEQTGAPHEATRFIQIARLNTTDPKNAAELLAREASIRYRESDFDQALPLLISVEKEFRQLGELETAISWGVRRLHATSEVGGLCSTESARDLDALLGECATRGYWERYVEGIECRLRILERENRVRELKETLGLLGVVPADAGPRVVSLVESVRSLGIVFADGKDALAAADRAYRLAACSADRDMEDRMLHRLIFVHFSGGTLNTSGGKQLLEARLSHSTKGETLKTRYGFLEAAALWRVEMGEYSAAESYFTQAEEVMRETPEVTDKVHMLANRGEQLALEGRLELAREYYERAYDALRPHHYWRAHQAVLGGLGYCALELGDLKLARLCEAKLEYENEAYFDPWMIVLFRTTLLRRRGQQSKAADYLSGIAHPFEGRLRTVPIKLRFLECRLRRLRDRPKALELAEWLIEETGRLQLESREAEAKSLSRLLGQR